jgi:hypothetical protein
VDTDTDTDTAELGERVARALGEENTGPLAGRVAVIAGRARTARLRAMRRPALYPEVTVTGPSRGDQEADSPQPVQGPQPHP